MPDHWHGLVELGALESLEICVGRMKGRTARALRQREHGLASIWSAAFHDRAIRREGEILSAARYLVLNPVRAGLVRRIGDSPWWDAVWL